jgi:putative copper resistance protein D
MLPIAVVIGRLAQFTCALVLLGAPSFFVYGLPAQGLAAARNLRWPRPLLVGAAIGLALAAIVALCSQTAVMSDTATDAFKPSVVASVITDTQFGRVTALRFGLAIIAALGLIVTKPSRGLWLFAAAVGALVVASFAWSGHGSADDGTAGWVHLMSDVLHLLAAAVWIGALVAFWGLLVRSKDPVAPEQLHVLHASLKGFSGIGSALVAVLLATGLINSWFLVGPAHLAGLINTPYGLMLSAKVALFVLMLGLAAANRFRLTPALAAALTGERSTADAVAALRRSVMLETAIGVLVLLIVSLLGTIAPLSAQ